MKKLDLIAIGEVLMDMTPVQNAPAPTFVANPGGAPCNVAVMASHMGLKTGFIGMVGHDTFGETLIETLKDHKVDTSGVISSLQYPTTLAFVHLDHTGERSFSFYRNQTADVQLTIADLNHTQLEKTQAVCFGSVAMVENPLRDTLYEALKIAKNKHALLCYDPNYRPRLWPDSQEALHWMREGLKWADVLKVSEEEALLLSESSTLEDAMAYFTALGIQLVCITLGERGAMVAYYDKVFTCPSPPVASVVDTTGAGDAFFGALIAGLINSGLADKGKVVEEEFFKVMLCVEQANAAAGLCIGKSGAIPAMPTNQQVLEAINASN